MRSFELLLSEIILIANCTIVKYTAISLLQIERSKKKLPSTWHIQTMPLSNIIIIIITIFGKV